MNQVATQLELEMAQKQIDLGLNQQYRENFEIYTKYLHYRQDVIG